MLVIMVSGFSESVSVWYIGFVGAIMFMILCLFLYVLMGILLLIILFMVVKFGVMF